MKEYLTITAPGLALAIGLLCIGCTKVEKPELQSPEPQVLETVQAELAWKDQPRAPTPPQGFKPLGKSLFGVDTTTQVIKTPVQGHAGVVVEGRLATATGQRTLVLVSEQGETEIAGPDWLSPPVAAMNSQGEILVCYNRFTGETTQLTQGMLPDPTQGLQALCRSWNGHRFEREVQVGSMQRVASWIINLNAQPNGQFRLQYLADDGWLMDPSPKHHFLAQVIEDGLVVSDEFLRPALDESR